MKHDLVYTFEDFTGPDGEPARRLSASCSCGWPYINERPVRPGRDAEMIERMTANHEAWRATPAVQEFEAAFDKLAADGRGRLEAAMEAKALNRADFGASSRAAIEAAARSEGLPSLWRSAAAPEVPVIDEVKRVP